MGLFKKKHAAAKETEQVLAAKEEKQYIPKAGGSMITRSVLDHQTRIRWVFREESINEVDNGWRVFGESDDEAYINQSQNHAIVDFNTLIDFLPALFNVYDMPVGSELMINYDEAGTHIINTQNGQEIKERVKSPLQLAFEHNLKYISKQEHDSEALSAMFMNTDTTTCFCAGYTTMLSGNIIVGDPLCYLQNDQDERVLGIQIPSGSYPVELAILYSQIAGVRIAGARLRIQEAHAARYELAEPAQTDMEKQLLAGFAVDAGLACFCDKESLKAYHQFLNEWYAQHPGKNLYNDYFAQLFANSYEQYPDVQRKGGDFIDWQIPGTSQHIVMFASGLGDGFYQSFWGYSDSGVLCELVIPFMDATAF